MAAEVKEVELEQRALTWPERARATSIVDQISYDEAAALLKDIAALEAEIVEHHKESKQKAHEAHQAICKAERRLLDPLSEAKKIIAGTIAVYEVEKERIRLDTERRVREEAERLAAEQERTRQERARQDATAANTRDEDARLTLAVEAETFGASDETIQEILETPILPPRPMQAPSAPAPFIPVAPLASQHRRAEGLSTNKRWKAEVTDLKELCRAVFEGRASTECVQPNMPTLNGLARAMKSTMNIPGVRAVPETGITVRR